MEGARSQPSNRMHPTPRYGREIVAIIMAGLRWIAFPIYLCGAADGQVVGRLIKGFALKHIPLIMAAAFLVVSLSACRSPVATLPPPPIATGSLDTAEAYLRRGDSYSEIQDYDRAIADYDEAIRLKPDYAEAYNNRGYAYYWKYEGANAIADYSRAIELRPDYAYAYNNRGAAYLASGNPAQAIRDFDHAIQLQPDFPQAYTNRGNAYLRRGRLNLAMADFSHGGQNPIGLVALLCALPVITVISGAVFTDRVVRQRLYATRRRALKIQ